MNFGDIQKTFFCGIYGSYKLQNYKIIKLAVFVRSWGEAGRGGVLNLSFERSGGGRGLAILNKCEQGGEEGPNFGCMKT